MVSLVLSLIVVPIYCFRGGFAGITLSGSEIQEAVDVHNKYRSDAGATAMQKLKWNDELAQFAQNSVSRCKFDHTSFTTRQNVAGFSYLGENIYTIAGAVEQPTLKAATEDWASEQKDYDLGSNWCRSVCGHYTQIVWSNTTDVGCAISKCDRIEDFSDSAGYLIFCNYGIGGNMIGQKPYEKASSSSDVGSKCQEYFQKSADGSGLCG